MSGPHVRDYHLLLDEHGDQLISMTDVIAERVRTNSAELPFAPLGMSLD
jgi:DNA-binding ferritin-like protein